eukprot:4880088-Pyramimonas_sp.AAC.1
MNGIAQADLATIMAAPYPEGNKRTRSRDVKQMVSQATCLCLYNCILAVVKSPRPVDTLKTFDCGTPISSDHNIFSRYIECFRDM